MSTRLHPDTDDLQKWTSFQHVVKIQFFCVNQAASGYRRPARKGSVFSISSKYSSSVSTRLHLDTDDLQKRISFQHVGILRRHSTGPLCQPGCIRIPTICKKRISFLHVGILRCQNTGQVFCASGYRRSAKQDQLIACWDSASSKYRSSVSVSTRLHPDTNDLQKDFLNSMLETFSTKRAPLVEVQVLCKQATHRRGVGKGKFLNKLRSEEYF